MVRQVTRLPGAHFKRWALAAVLLGVTLACAVPVPTVEPLTKIEPVDEVQIIGLEGAERAEVRLRLVSDSIIVRPQAGLELLRGRFSYNVDEWSPNVKQDTDAGLTRVTIGQGIGSQIPLGKSDEYFNAWEIELAPGIPLDLGVDIGSGQAALDLTGLSVRNLGVTTGSADVSLAFNAFNPEPLALLRLTTGTGKFIVSGLGNANFDRLSVLGGAGTVDLDFSGAMRRAAIVDVKAGAGKINVRVPSTLGVRVTFTSTPASSVDAVGFSEQSDNVYINAAYGQAMLTLTLNITAGIGSVTLVSQS